MSVANAIKEQLKEHMPRQKVEIIDFFEKMAPKRYKHMYKGYQSLIKLASPVFNCYYYAKEKISGVKRLDTLDLSIRKNLEELLQRKKPQLVISTFPVCSGYLSNYKSNVEEIRFVSVITDIVATKEWIYEGTDYYCVATPQIKQEMIEEEVESSKILVTGIPLRKKFYYSIPNERNNIKKYLPEIPEDKKVITLLGGGLGLLPTNLSFYQWIARLPDVYIVVITGKNAKLREKLQEKLDIKNMTVLGYIDFIEPLMRRSEFIVGKPGGITLFEALILKVPFVLITPKLGQEVENAKYIEKHKLGCVANDNQELKKMIRRMVLNEDIPKVYKENMEKFGQEINPLLLVEKIKEWCES